MAGESYQRAYGAMVVVQMLAELEEVIQYKLVPERRPTLCAMWWQRLQSGQRLAEDWQRILQVHSLVLSPREDVHTWLKYASLCRKSGSLVSNVVYHATNDVSVFYFRCFPRKLWFCYSVTIPCTIPRVLCL